MILEIICQIVGGRVQAWRQLPKQPLDSMILAAHCSGMLRVIFDVTDKHGVLCVIAEVQEANKSNPEY
jgi:hypothetical protein